MRPLPLALLAASALAACKDDPETGPPLDDGAEVARPPVELLVERVTRGGERSFYTMGPDGSFVSERAGYPRDAFRLTPSPDGRTIAYLLPGDGVVHAWLMDRDGSSRRPLLEGARALEDLAWSPDGTRLALGGTDYAMGGADDVFVVNADGSGLANLTPDPLPGIWLDRAPAWSPDGARIAFSSNRSGTTRLWVMNADGSGAAPVIDPTFASSERAPVWSADGALIAFVGERPGEGGVAVVRPDGTGYRLFPIRALLNRLAWSPDGRVLHATTENFDAEIFALDVATGARANLTRHREHDLEAQPLRHVAPAAWRGLAGPAIGAGGATTASAVGPEEVRPMMRVSIPADLPMMAGASPIRPMSCSPAANDSFIGGPARKELHFTIVPSLRNSSCSQPFSLATYSGANCGMGCNAIRISLAAARWAPFSPDRSQPANPPTNNPVRTNPAANPFLLFMAFSSSPGRAT